MSLVLAPRAVYDAIIVNPLQYLYVRGVWGSLPLADICAQLTRHRSEFWQMHPAECSLIVRNNFESWLVWGHFIAYILAIFVALRFCGALCWHALTTARPCENHRCGGKK